MLIDWHTNLQLPEHADDGDEMITRVGIEVDATPKSHEKHIVKVAKKFALVTMNFPRLKVRVPNEFVAEYAQKYRGRAKAFACVNPLDKNAPRELEHAIRGLGMHGLKISPVYGGFDPWCKEAGRIYKTCDRLRIPLLWHQSAGYAADCTLEHGNPILLDRIAREFPKLRMIVAHVGQPWVGECMVLLRKHPHILADLSARFHRKWQLYNGLMLALDYKVTKQLLFGSDFPLRTTTDALREFRALNEWGEGVTMPKFPPEIIEDIIENRPFELLWPEG
ncbi:MAG: amidohydrolase [Alphaproteobacteria bacterium]|nr:amidohydrolase [Alphaproteobacteria bacterium]